MVPLVAIDTIGFSAANGTIGGNVVNSDGTIGKPNVVNGSILINAFTLF